MGNILLSANLEIFDINFNELNNEEIKEAYDFFLLKAEEEFKASFNKKIPTYKELFQNLFFDKLASLHHLVGSLNTLVENEERRNIEEKYSAILSVKFIEWSLNMKRYKKIEKFTLTKEYEGLSILRKKMIQKILKELKDSGINLPSKEKKKLAKLNQRLSILGQKFQNNITDAQANLCFIVNEKDLKGLSKRALKNIEQLSKEQDLPAGKYYIDEPSGATDDVMQNGLSEGLRKKIYIARRKLCVNGKYNNSMLIDKIYKLKQEIAMLLGYKDYAHMCLEDEMAQTPLVALDFLNKLGNIALPHAQKESEHIQSYGAKILKRKMEWWDHEYVATDIMKKEFKVDPELIRMYFSVDNTVKGLFDLCHDMFNIEVKQNMTKSTWHSDVKYFDVYENSIHIGGIFMDLYKRPGKTPGAWLDPLCSYENNDLSQTKPVALLVCNAPKDSGQEPTFELDDVVTLFHEMGHALHHLLSKVEEEFFSGFNNVEHDAVEIPSQLMENFVYEADVLKKLGKHIITGEGISKDLIEKIQKSKKFMGASIIVNMVRYSEMDMKLYMQKDLHPYDLENEAMKKWKITDNYDKDRRRMAIFSHIFGGGYAAGYYAYQWAEVFAADGYNYLSSGTEDEKKEKVRKYKEEILYTGGKQSMKDNYSLFKPEEVDLKHLINNYL